MTTTGTEHTIKAFDAEIRQLRGLISEMGAKAEDAIDQSMAALVSGDKTRAAQIVADDKQIDLLEAEVERLSVQIIALRAPMADDLREVMAAIKIAGVIERIGDYAKNIAKRVNVLESKRGIEPLSLLPAMAERANDMVRDVLDAFARRDAEAAVAVIEADRVVDDFYNSIFRTLLTHMMEDPKSISDAAHLLFVAKNLERIGDHATNVAEMVYFAATGEYLVDRETGADVGGEGA